MSKNNKLLDTSISKEKIEKESKQKYQNKNSNEHHRNIQNNEFDEFEVKIIDKPSENYEIIKNVEVTNRVSKKIPKKNCNKIILIIENPLDSENIEEESELGTSSEESSSEDEGDMAGLVADDFLKLIPKIVNKDKDIYDHNKKFFPGLFLKIKIVCNILFRRIGSAN